MDTQRKKWSIWPGRGCGGVGGSQAGFIKGISLRLRFEKWNVFTEQIRGMLV